jgi:hypothetical protein
VAVRGNDMLAGEGADGAKSVVSVTACEGEGRVLSRPAEGGGSELPASEGLWRCDCGMAEVREVKNRRSRVEDRGSRIEDRGRGVEVAPTAEGVATRQGAKPPTQTEGAGSGVHGRGSKRRRGTVGEQEGQVLERRWWCAWRCCGDIVERWAAAGRGQAVANGFRGGERGCRAAAAAAAVQQTKAQRAAATA